MIKNFLSNLLHLVPRELRYEICRHHADKEHAEENNSDFTTNGELWLLDNVLPDSKTVFDVGSFIGKWASSALGINPRIDMHCFEPSQRSFREFQNNGFGDNITCNQFGLGSKNYQAKLFVYDGLTEGNSLYLRKELSILSVMIHKLKLNWLKSKRSTVIVERRASTRSTFSRLMSRAMSLQLCRAAKSCLNRNASK
jgi:FkbM family methyltransferase